MIRNSEATKFMVQAKKEKNIRSLFHRRQRVGFEMQQPTPLDNANISNNEETMPPQVFVGTIFQVNNTKSNTFSADNHSNHHTINTRTWYGRRKQTKVVVEEPRQPMPPQGFNGTIIAIIQGNNMICYKIRPDLVDGHQFQDEHGVWHNDNEITPVGAKVSYIHASPKDQTIFLGAVTITDYWFEAI